MNELILKATLQQQLKLTPQLMQSMEVLQMNSQELVDYLGRITEENPLLEQDDSHALRTAYEELRQKASWLDGGVYGATFAHGDSDLPERGATDKETDSLFSFLCDQLERKHLPKPQLALCRYMAELVDEDGRLLPEDLDGLTLLKIPEDMISQAITTLQTLEPAGIGARSLSECLVLQLQRMKSVPTGAIEIAQHFLTELSRKHYGPITRELGLSIAQIQEVQDCIATLEPHPGRTFQPAEPTIYVRPDVFIVELEGELQVVLNEYYLPRVSISNYYTKLLKDSGEADTRTYLAEKLQQARWLLNALERRGSTLQQCANAVLETQRSFFAGTSAELAPMKLVTLAEQIGVHPSTVSRALRGKYLQCRQGTFPLRYFFSHAVGEDGLSEQAIKGRMLKLLKAESPQKPLSDQKLCTLLAQDGIQLARRTVTKYRLELGFGSSTARKQRT